MTPARSSPAPDYELPGKPKLKLEALAASFVVTRLGPDAEIPDWVHGHGFVSITRSSHELSIVCEQSLLPRDQDFEGPFRCLEVQGPIPFTEFGILASLAQPLADEQISIFAISTFDTDYILVPQNEFERSLEALSKAGHSLLRNRRVNDV